MKILIQTLLILSISSVIAQPNLTLWQIEDPAQNHSDNHSHDAQLYICGSQYYFTSEGVEDRPVSFWSIKNEGDENLVIDLPLKLTGASERFTILSQPNTNSLAPNEETIFSIQYNSIETDLMAELNVESNDIDGNCSYFFNGGRLTVVFPCFCNSNNVVAPGGWFVGGNAGILIENSTTGMCSNVGMSCQPISISDPTDCSQIVTVGGQQLFRDTLTIDAAPGQDLFTLTSVVNDADSTFLDASGNAYNNSTVFIKSGHAGGLPILTEPSPGVYKIPFYRLPETAVSIALDGTPFKSGDAPSLASCSATAGNPIPTLSEWGLILMFLFLVILGLTVLNKHKVILITQKKRI